MIDLVAEKIARRVILGILLGGLLVLGYAVLLILAVLMAVWREWLAESDLGSESRAAPRTMAQDSPSALDAG